MPELQWQKSSFSGPPGNSDCLEIARGHSGTYHVRESDAPATTLTPTPTTLRALLTHAQRGALDRP
ncbi:DUF397 domain-containing protein [Streptomyces sp. AV19]|uniref:DUF397 domain-containing protein n=1 Tax=Streptomyces sp. AV19 TaxID=2793068 RepID=UPI0018FEC1E5|nr:DUF397 domain-containing protein [Streptomyces sp. AV19]MBH1936194.1 DUF397 domain-containing protein [Streptomyces sp. AV19]MDG4534618.1 DUF397 domain-containing protein [Streptomyces sp. AV19]